MQGAVMVRNARMYHEILRPYAGIIRIRSMGIISASVTRAPLQIFPICRCKYTENLNYPTPAVIKSLYLNQDFNP